MLFPAQRSQVRIGDTTITYLPDGEVHLHPACLFPASAPDGWSAYTPYLDRDGRLPVSVGSFLIRTGSHTALIDLGLGDVDFEVADLASFHGGALLDSLAAEGLSPADIDTVVYSHLHHDHVGWTTNVAPAPNADPDQVVTGLTFPQARHFVQRAEWEHWNGTAEIIGPDPDAVQKPLAGVIEFLANHHEIMPGLRAVPTPGHTPGHSSVLVTDPASEQRLLILGDVMHTQVQITETQWSFLFDVDPTQGTKTRIELLERHTDSQTIIAGGHFAGSVFGRFLPPTLRHGWATAAAVSPSVLQNLTTDCR